MVDSSEGFNASRPTRNTSTESIEVEGGREVDGSNDTGTESGELPLASCVLEVGGMDCAGCARTVEKALTAVTGVREARADVVGARVTVRFLAGAVDRAELAKAVRRAGYVIPEGTARERRVAEKGSPARPVQL